MQVYCNNCKKNIYTDKESFPIFCCCGQVIRSKHKEPIVIEKETFSHLTIDDQFPTLAAPWVTENKLVKDIQILFSKISHLNIERVIGVPRSGMIPASILSVKLGVPLGSVSNDGIINLSSGIRLRGSIKSKGLTVIVEDSSATGWSINELKNKIDLKDTIFAAVYVTPSSEKRVDYYSKILPLPHWFSWNIFGNINLLHGFNIGTDMDGVLCSDCSFENDDDGERYLNWIKDVPSKIRILDNPIPFIITARLEKYRKETEKWLLKNHIKYGKLIMGPWETKEERNKYCMGTYKLEKIKENFLQLFIESDDIQARIISRNWKQPVICTDSETSYVNGIGPKWRNVDDEASW